MQVTMKWQLQEDGSATSDAELPISGCITDLHPPKLPKRNTAQSVLRDFTQENKLLKTVDFWFVRAENSL